MTPLVLSRIKEKLDDIITYYHELMNDFPTEHEFKENRLARRGIEKTVELIAESVLDVTMMLISSKGIEKPQDSRTSIALLEKHGILSKKLSLKLQDFISFRNLLVHRYARVDEEQEYETIDENHEDILHFVEEIELFLKKRKSTTPKR